MMNKHHTARDYADAVEAALERLRKHDDVLSPLMSVDWQIDVTVGERASDDGVGPIHEPMVEWSADGYTEAYGPDPVAADYSRGGWRESTEPEAVAERIAAVWEETAQLAIHCEMQRMWEAITGDDSEYPGVDLEVGDLEYVYLEMVVWEHYFYHRVGKVAPREAVAAYHSAPEPFWGKRGAFVEVYGAAPEILLQEGESND